MFVGHQITEVNQHSSQTPEHFNIKENLIIDHKTEKKSTEKAIRNRLTATK